MDRRDRRKAEGRRLWAPLAVALAGTLALFCVPASAEPSAQRDGLPPGASPAVVWVNGRPAPDARPSFVWAGTVMAPARAFEALGAAVQWRAHEQATRIRHGDRWIEARVGRTDLATAGGTVTLPRPPVLVGGRLVLPARAVAEALGFEVRWDPGRRLVQLVGPEERAQRPVAAGRPATAAGPAPNPTPGQQPAPPAAVYRPSSLPPLPPHPDDPRGVWTLVAQLPQPIGPALQAPMVPIGRALGQAPADAALPAAPQGAADAPLEPARAAGSPSSPGTPEYRPTPLDARIRALPDLAAAPEDVAPAPQLAAQGVRLPSALDEAAAPSAPRPAEGQPAQAPRAEVPRPTPPSAPTPAVARPAAPAPASPPAPATAASPPAAPAPGPAAPKGSAAGSDAPAPEKEPSRPEEDTRPLPRGQVVGIDVRRTGGRARVDILRDGPVTLMPPTLLADPPRLVFDLEGAELAAPTLEYEVDGPILKRVRLGQTKPDVVRVALDLNTLVGYSLTDGSESTTIWLNHQVSAVYWIPDPQAPAGGQLWIEMSGYAPVRTATLDNPRRLVVDVHEATLTASPAEWAVSAGPVTRIRVSQHQPDVVRVVLELAAPVLPRIVASADLARQALSDAGPAGGAAGDRSAPTLDVVLDVFSRIRRVALSQVGRSGVSLVVEGTSPLEARAFYLQDPHRLVVDLPGAVLEPAAGGPRGEFRGAGPVRVVRTGQYLPRSARIVVELEQAVAHRLFRTEEGTTVVVALGTEPLSGRAVAIDPGHGGMDTGAVGASGTPEKFYNLDIARRLARLLQSMGVEVTLTRDEDVFISLDERVERARAAGAEVLVSIHNNASPSGQASGTEVLYAPQLPESRRLAQLLYEELVSRLGTQGRGLKARRNLRVLRLAPMPAALVEVAFVDHRGDEQRLLDPAFRQRAAEALFSAIVGYFSSVGNDNQEAAAGPPPRSDPAGRAR